MRSGLLKYRKTEGTRVQMDLSLYYPKSKQTRPLSVLKYSAGHMVGAQ